MLRARGIADLNLVIATRPRRPHRWTGRGPGGLPRALVRRPGPAPHDRDLHPPHGARRDPGAPLAPRGRTFSSTMTSESRCWPPQPLLTGTRSDLNSNSVVTRLTHGSNCFLFTGDAEEPTSTSSSPLASGPVRCSRWPTAPHTAPPRPGSRRCNPRSPSSAWARATGMDTPTRHLGRLEAAGATVPTDLHGTLVTSNKRRIGSRSMSR